MDFPLWLKPYHPLVPLETLVTEVNRIYHSFDAMNYDADHIEIQELWPSLWKQMIQHLPDRRRWRVLDFGCGTGFEAMQVLKSIGSDIEILVAYDPSEEMLGQCRLRLQDNLKVSFTDTIPTAGPFNLLITNSVLHHLADIEETLSRLCAVLSEDAYWLSGNEPSARFYRNYECVQLFNAYTTYRERMKWFKPSSYIDKLRRLLGFHTLSASARVAVQRGLFADLPSDIVIARLVDFHVPHFLDEAKSERGLDIVAMQPTMNNWSLRWSTTYSYLGLFSELRAPQSWRHKASLLRERFPLDGANFCAVWSRYCPTQSTPN